MSPENVAQGLSGWMYEQNYASLSTQQKLEAT